MIPRGAKGCPNCTPKAPRGDPRVPKGGPADAMGTFWVPFWPRWSTPSPGSNLLISCFKIIFGNVFSNVAPFCALVGSLSVSNHPSDFLYFVIDCKVAWGVKWTATTQCVSQKGVQGANLRPLVSSISRNENRAF